MAAPESAGLWFALKWVAGIITGSGLFGYFWRKQVILEGKLDKVYDKQETQEQIELRIKPIQTSLDENTQAVTKLTDTLVTVRIGQAEVVKDVENIKGK